jgi:hypothetical protein
MKGRGWPLRPPRDSGACSYHVPPIGPPEDDLTGEADKARPLPVLREPLSKVPRSGSTAKRSGAVDPAGMPADLSAMENQSPGQEPGREVLASTTGLNRTARAGARFPSGHPAFGDHRVLEDFQEVRFQAVREDLGRRLAVGSPAELSTRGGPVIPPYSLTSETFRHKRDTFWPYSLAGYWVKYGGLG